MAHKFSDRDADVLRKLLLHDEHELRAFYDQHKAPLKQFIARSLTPDDADEVLQDAFLGFIESLRNFRGQSSLKTFLYSIAKRKIIDKLRRKRLKKVLFSYLPAHFVESLAVVFLQDSLDAIYVRKKIERIFSTLPHDYARVLRLKYIEGEKVAAISARMGISFKAVESLLFRARKAFIHEYSHYDGPGILTDSQKI